jgi:8-oxo-dGTP pyrophosphatase MutT (NUDIX family)
MTDVYRQAASILVLRPVSACGPDGCGDAYQILLLHKPRRRDNWQIPQGGIEHGEDVEKAALRELEEEAGLKDCRVLGQSAKLYQYDFPSSFRRFRPDNVRGQQIRFVYALAPKDAKVRVDGKEIDGHTWTEKGKLSAYLKRKEYLGLVNDLYDEAVDLIEHTL